MGRLIDADVLRDAIKRHAISIYDIDGLILDAPTIDPVRHGRWIGSVDYVTTAYGQLDVYRCSECGANVTIDDHDSYCPSCGAEMDMEASRGS